MIKVKSEHLTLSHYDSKSKLINLNQEVNLLKDKINLKEKPKLLRQAKAENPSSSYSSTEFIEDKRKLSQHLSIDRDKEKKMIRQPVNQSSLDESRARTSHNYFNLALSLFKFQSRSSQKAKSDESGEEENICNPITANTGNTNKSQSSVSISEHSIVSEKPDPYILGIHIHNTDRKLKGPRTIVHPMVKVHVIDKNTGCYLLKKNANRDVASFYETVHSKINYILPIMTQNCDLVQRIRYPRYPIWEELLLYNEDYSHFLQPNVVIFFEILDFITLSETTKKNNVTFKRNEWWYRIAWAFLPIKSSDGTFNTGRKLRLQLFKPVTQKVNTNSQNSQTTEIYDWWKNDKKIVDRAAIYVTLSPIPLVSSKETFKPSLRSLGPFQEERASKLLLSMENNFDPTNVNTVNKQETSIWSRVEGQPCKVPKNLWHEFSAGNNKCNYSVKFSRDGTKIACGASVFTAYKLVEKRSSIFIYQIPSGKFLKRVNGLHNGVIYEIDWSLEDKYILSASSDCTTHIWNNVKEYQSSIMLPHPCFVYSARFHPIDFGLVFTGAYDGLIRLWSIRQSLESTAIEPQLVQEIDCLYGHILTMNWKIDQGMFSLFAGGSKGDIVILKQRELHFENNWIIASRLKLKELANLPINNVVVYPHENKILIICRDGIQRMVDYQLELVVRRYTGSLNFHHLIRGTISPCGRLIFNGSEDGVVHVWNSETGERIYTYTQLPFKGPITCLAYHPYDHILAVCGLNARTISVCLFHYEIDKNTMQSFKSEKELEKCKTFDQTDPEIGKAGFKVQKAMKKLELAIRLGSFNKS